MGLYVSGGRRIKASPRDPSTLERQKLLELPPEHRRFFCAYKNYS